MENNGGARARDADRMKTRAQRQGRRRRAAVVVLLLVLMVLLPMVAAIAVLEHFQVAPRELSRYIVQRSAGHNPLISGAGGWIGRVLLTLDRGPVVDPDAGVAKGLPMPAIVARSLPVADGGATSIPTTQISVSSPAEIIAAINTARPGQQIVIAPGTYRFNGNNIPVRRPGSVSAPITVRAATAGTVRFEVDTVDGFRVSAPHWIFENLVIRGVCASHDRCEHAFHVVGAATDFIARNNTVVDFNAHFKINAEDGASPDAGRIENNRLFNTGIRQTANPVAPIDLVGASHWSIRGNTIADFVKGQGNRISYGGFFKGGGSDNVFERNIVVCEQQIRGATGQTVGFSLGGGGTEAPYCRDGRCVTEQARGLVGSNLIQSCSDDGIDVNRSSESRIVHNTLIDTAGISVRAAESSAVVEGNLVDGAIKIRDTGSVRAVDNLTTGIAHLYFGQHPIRGFFVNAVGMDYRWTKTVPAGLALNAVPPDLCAEVQPRRPVFGAFADFSACVTGVGRMEQATQTGQ
ncbi:MAG: right-handed parallel beta-helix repeat-containing protein [Casimicrobiaceae bacterium]